MSVGGVLKARRRARLERRIERLEQQLGKVSGFDERLRRVELSLTAAAAVLAMPADVLATEPTDDQAVEPRP